MDIGDGSSTFDSGERHLLMLLIVRPLFLLKEYKCYNSMELRTTRETTNYVAT
jgi:hypothetical protein